jgi:UDP-2-acetamido-3-amino-2,3-dideoxy-glucuronate N-acetyltransferase
VENGAVIGDGSQIWHQDQVRTRARIGARCIVGKGAFVDFDVTIGA